LVSLYILYGEVQTNGPYYNGQGIFSDRLDVAIVKDRVEHLKKGVISLKTRLAPTPSGFLHIGNALSFALTWALARQQGGVLALRIDDLDNARFRQEYLQDIFDTLHFLGLDYDEGPRHPADFRLNYSQLHRLPLYHELLDRLAQQGLVYACPCSRTQIAAVSPEGLYPGTCRNKQLPLDTPGLAWRLRVPEGGVVAFQDLCLGEVEVPLGEVMPDFVIRRKDGVPAYQVASVVDDVRMGVNLVVRGQDLLSSTAAQLFLARLVGEEAFTKVRFVHHPLVQEPSGGKLSKSHDSLSLFEMRKRGVKPAEVWGMLARLLGWPEEVREPQAFLKGFRQRGMPGNLQSLP
jgi:glutamyl/glutaminyl-tRNA synthetase